MENKFVPYPIALMLKELGYNEPCLAWFGISEILNHVGEIKLYMVGQPNNYEIYTTKTEYFFCNQKDTDVDAPLWQDVIDWFREKHNIHIWIYYDMILENSYYQIRHEVNKSSYHHYTNENAYHNMHEIDYPTSREHAILKAIEIIKKK